jgi:Ni/Fe-hydrogenase subunit HybB-like protein
MSGADTHPIGTAPPVLHRAHRIAQESGGIQLPMQPVVLPGYTPEQMVDKICALVLRERVFFWWWVLLLPFLALFAIGLCSAFWLFYKGPGVWGVDWPVMWGFALVNYVWWIAIASGGTFISALFFLARAEWRASINRTAETMLLFAAAAAGIYPIMHLGRPWFAYWLFPYPDTMALWPQFRSPLFWDFAALFAYVVASILYWYFGLIPDFASVRDRAKRRGAQVFYGVLAFGFRGSRSAWRHFRATYAIMAALMAPLVISVHSFVGNDFSGAQTTGWHSTEFPPFFVFGALHSGFAVVVFLIIPLRRLYRLEPYITARHIEVLGRLMIATTFAMAYAYLMDAFNSFYSQDKFEHLYASAAMFGPYGWVFWGKVTLNVLVTQLLWLRPVRLNQIAMMLIALGVIVGMWLERFQIVITSLSHTKMPSAWGYFHATFWDWTLMAGTIGMFFSGFLIAIRIVPAISMHEVAELMHKKSAA